jgi:hypothetical protein
MKMIGRVNWKVDFYDESHQRFDELASLFCNSPPYLRCAPESVGAFHVVALRSRLQGETIFHWVGGQRLAIRHGMTGATQNIYVGLHEFADTMLPLHFLREGDLFLGIGANVGTYTVIASGVCRAKT